MSGEDVKDGEFQRLLTSIDSSNQCTASSLKTLTESIVEIKEYIIHNDYRHSGNESEIKVIKKDLASILEILDERKSMWSAFKKSRLIVGIVSTGVLAAAGGGIYNYIFKPQPVINQTKEKPKVEVKPVTKDLIK